MKANPCGTPQGGVISPLLANIYLHPLDEAVNEKCRDRCGYKPRMIRYADDLVILCQPGEGGGIKERLARWLQSHGLALNERKTRVLESRENGFEFLGFSFRWQHSKKGTLYVHTEPSPAAEQALRDRVRELTRRLYHVEGARRGRARDQPSDPWLGQLLCSGPLPPKLRANESLRRPSAPAMAMAQARECAWENTAAGRTAPSSAPMDSTNYRHIWNRIRIR